jgi:hypothetical protein
MFSLPSKKTVLAALPFIAGAAAVPCVQFDADWSLYAFGGSEDVKLGGSGSWGCKSSLISDPSLPTTLSMYTSRE